MKGMLAEIAGDEKRDGWASCCSRGCLSLIFLSWKFWERPRC